MSTPAIRPDLPSVTRADPEQAQPKNNAAFEAGVPGVIFGRRSVTSAGLVWGYYGGAFKAGDGTTIGVLNGTVALTASAHNYVEASTAGAVSANTVGFTAGAIPLYEVYTTDLGVADWIDRRTGTQGSGPVGAISFVDTPGPRIPRVWFGPTGAVYDTFRTITQTDSDTTQAVHAYEDNNTLAMTHSQHSNFNAYASFDAHVQITGAGAYSHHVSFQARPVYTGSGSIYERWDGLHFHADHTGTGVVTALRGVVVENPTGTGPITNLYGIFCQKLTRGSTDNFGFYSATELNAISVGTGESATWLLRGNGQTGGFGLVLQSAADSTARVLQTANSTLRLGTNNVDTLVGTADGRWKMAGAGTTASDMLTSAQTLEVSGTGGVSHKATGAATNACVLDWHSATSGDNLFIGFYTEATPTLRGSVDYNRAGVVTRYNTTSDATMKNVFGDAPSAKSLAILDSTKLREYAWKDDPTQKAQIGVIAQELHETFPGAVSVGDENRLWAVDKTAFTFHLIAGYQAQKARIEALEARIAALEI